MPALVDELNTLEREALARLSEAPDEKGLEEWRVEVLGRRGGLAELLRGLGPCPPRSAPPRGGGEPGQGGPRSGLRRAPAVAAGAVPGAGAGGGADRRHPPRAGLPAGPAAPGDPATAGGGADLHPPRLHRGGGARGGARPLQLHPPEHARGPPLAGRPGHLLRGQRGGAQSERQSGGGAAHAHLPGADPDHAGAAPADPDHRPRPGLPQRGHGRRPTSRSSPRWRGCAWTSRPRWATCGAA